MKAAIVFGFLAILVGCGGGDGGDSSDLTSESTIWTESSGVLDLTWGNSGIATIASVLPSSFFTASVLDAEGRLVAAGYASSGSFFFAIVCRFNRNGILDPSFGGTGYVTQAIGAADAYPHKGWRSNPMGRSWLWARTSGPTTDTSPDSRRDTSSEEAI